MIKWLEANSMPGTCWGAEQSRLQASQQVVRRLLGSQSSDNLLALLERWLLELRILRQIVEDMFHDATAFIDVGHFSASEHHRDYDLVLVLQKPDGLAYFRFDIVIASLRTQADFLGLRLVCLLSGLFILLVLVLAEVHDSTNRWSLVRSYFHQIQSSFSSSTESVFDGDDSILSSIGANDP